MSNGLKIIAHYFLFISHKTRFINDFKYSFQQQLYFPGIFYFHSHSGFLKKYSKMAAPNYSIPCNPRYLKYCFYFFKVFGVATMSHKIKFSENKKMQCLLFVPSKYGILYNLFLSIFILSICGNTIQLALLGNYADRAKFERIVDTVHTGLTLFTTIFILILSCTHQNWAVEIANELNSVSAISRSLDTQRTKLKGIRNLVIFSTLTTAQWFFSIPTAYPMFTLYFVTAGLNHFIINALLLQYSIILKLIQHFFCVINKSLVQMFEIQTLLHEIHYNTRSYDNVWLKSRKLSQLRELCIMIGQLSENLSSFYSLPMLLCIPNIFFTLIVYGYYVIKPLIVLTELQFRVILHCGAQFIFSAISLIILTTAATRAVNEVRSQLFYSFIIHGMFFYINYIQLSSQVRLERFSVRTREELTTYKWLTR